MSSHSSSQAPGAPVQAQPAVPAPGPGQPRAQGQALAQVPDRRMPVLPSAGSIIQAGAFGAALSGVTAGLTETLRVQAGEITAAEAVQDVAKSSLQGALTMAVASSVGHMVRARPVIGLAILATAGIGAFLMMGEKKRRRRPARTVVRSVSVPAGAEAAAPAQATTAAARPAGKTTRTKATAGKTAATRSAGTKTAAGKAAAEAAQPDARAGESPAAS